jgi:hypothetical protein
MNTVQPKICPLLTAGTLQVQNALRMMQPQEAGVIGANLQVTFVGCQKEKCAWWTNGAAGSEGDCALKVLAVEMSAVADK